MEKAHDISLDEPTVAHQAILFMLDVLMRNDNQAMSISQLYDSFGDKSFTPQMLRAVGGNEQGLKQFLLKYPSLFSVIGDNIVANSGNSMRTTTPERTSYLKRNKSKEDDMSLSFGEQQDSKTMKEIEQEAIAFFKKCISKREEDWLPIVSVAGHASQASGDVRKYVGPQNEFKAFLIRYPHIFVVRDEFCGLKGKADLSTAPFPPPSPPPKRRVIGSTGLSRNQSFKNRYSTCSNSASLPPALNGLGPGSSNVNINSLPTQMMIQKPRLTPIEVKAVHYVMRILHKQGRLLLQNIPGLISRAPDHVSNVVGFTREDLIQFFKRHSAIFQLHPDGCVSVKQDAIKALILKDNSFCDSSLFTGNGTVLRIFPKYGILNLDNNEQVFFDIQSCQFETFSDLTTILHPGDRLWFNAVIGPRDGSTKWRSLKTWIKTQSNQQLVNDNLSASDGTSSNDGSHSMNGSTNSVSHANGANITLNGLNNQNPYAQHTHHHHHQMHTQQHSLNEDFNQYQLEMDYGSEVDLQSDSSFSLNNTSSNTNGTNGGNLTQVVSDEFNRLSISSTIQVQPHTQVPPYTTSTTTTSSSSSSQNSAQKLYLSNNKDLITMSSSLTSTQLIRQAPDNISQREINTNNSNLINMGCQTVSTGEIMATNIYIE